jgi:hypothetical protein
LLRHQQQSKQCEKRNHDESGFRFFYTRNFECGDSINSLQNSFFQSQTIVKLR